MAATPDSPANKELVLRALLVARVQSRIATVNVIREYGWRPCKAHNKPGDAPNCWHKQSLGIGAHMTTTGALEYVTTCEGARLWRELLSV